MKAGELSRHRVSLTDPRAIATRRTQLGVIVLTYSMHILYLNKNAHELSAQFVQAQDDMGLARGVVPPDLTQFCQELVGLTTGLSNPKDCEEVHLKRVIGNSRCPLLVEGFAIPDPTAVKEGRILLVMQPICTRQEGAAKQAKERYNLTDREESVVVCLSMGLSNKEIGLKLGVTEPTVKEHLRHIMHKMKTASRTGVLAKILFEEREYVAPKPSTATKESAPHSASA